MKYRVVESLSSAAKTNSVSEDRMLAFLHSGKVLDGVIEMAGVCAASSTDQALSFGPEEEETTCPIFRNAMAELGRLLIYEASRDLLMMFCSSYGNVDWETCRRSLLVFFKNCESLPEDDVETYHNWRDSIPNRYASVEFIDPREPVAVVPILRAGLALVEHASSILPSMSTYHLGVSRDEVTLQPTVYLNKLADTFPEGSRVLVADPMLATGGTILAVLNLLMERGVSSKQIKVISAVAAPPALQKLSENFWGLHVYTGIIDPTVNEKGFIIPGLGDAGDPAWVPKTNYPQVACYYFFLGDPLVRIMSTCEILIRMIRPLTEKSGLGATDFKSN